LPVAIMFLGLIRNLFSIAHIAGSKMRQSLSTHELLRKSIVQNHVEQRFMNPDATVVFNKAELAKAIHEEADRVSGWSQSSPPVFPV
jgi:hypothetical protein